MLWGYKVVKNNNKQKGKKKNAVTAYFNIHMIIFVLPCRKRQDNQQTEVLQINKWEKRVRYMMFVWFFKYVGGIKCIRPRGYFEHLPTF